MCDVYTVEACKEVQFLSYRNLDEVLFQIMVSHENNIIIM